ncbi:MAG TPA: CpsD/CapB family tyrosine-protein kinase [Pyrinomonadaceae bacterium]|jgi:capsular exopolysaccharide synthesis family protein|nr:CpsD/CapB family tyrosine-protein kinase [Pyrinomonadaceae bacterium]
MKRAGAEDRNGAGKKKTDAKASAKRGAKKSTPDEQVVPANGSEHPWDRSSLFDAPPPQEQRAAHTSASTAHTEEGVGSALPGEKASRAAGATLDAAGSARVPAEFVSEDISPARVEPHLVAVTQPRSAYCEQFRSLRTRVLQAGERKKMQAFVITSAGVAEGKTLTALNLAWLLAQTDGVRALLIDSDLRQPCATDYLGMDASQGLSEVLAGEATLEETIIRLEPAGLHLLPGGAARDDVAELLSGPKFGRILSEVRRMFDYVIIDAPPLGIFTDATVLINRADGALLVVRAGKTRYETVDRLLEQLPRERMLGVVLNRAEEQLDESSYYYQRRYNRRRDEVVPPGAKTTMKEGEEVAALS